MRTSPHPSRRIFWEEGSQDVTTMLAYHVVHILFAAARSDQEDRKFEAKCSQKDNRNASPLLVGVQELSQTPSPLKYMSLCLLLLRRGGSDLMDQKTNFPYYF